MPPDPTPEAARRAVTQLDHRVEAATGHDVDTLWTHRDRGVLDEPHARLADHHRELATAETGVTFYRTLLHRLSAGSSPSMPPWSTASTARSTNWRRPPPCATPPQPA
ncbi:MULTISPECIES: hypothetical protein [Streptomyces]|uniref:hypothetical protein n=1 Tax=Streptomyces TaxID=1883 RepID=UPI002B056DDA|nr:hypothetical protein [Streptomyces sp. JHD 1]